jgi:hypothetical protein
MGSRTPREILQVLGKDVDDVGALRKCGTFAFYIIITTYALNLEY